MGTTATVRVVDGDPGIARRAQLLLEQLHARWSRFSADSDVSRLNAAGGAPVAVHPDTVRLVETAITAWAATDGRFDPTVHDAVVAAGYDRTFEALPPARPGDGTAPGRTPGCAGIEVDRAAGTVRLPRGVRLDPGGIGKGLAADLVVDRLADEAAGLCVDVGGDLRVTGRSPQPGGWRIAIEPVGAVLTLRDGAVATSSTQRRRWVVDGAVRHHAVDPATGRTAVTAVATATVVAGTGWLAEAVATAAVLGPDLRRAREAVEGHVEGAVIVDITGAVAVTGRIGGGRRWTPTPGGTSPAPAASSPGR